KYIEPVKSDPPAWFANKRIESGLSKEVQLYNLENDSGEQKNVALKYPEKVKEMQQMLIEIRKTGIR
ncbi:MAG: arylsulfatase, partial [Bacteroidetes bacterium]|nr:arylsulfatase [Bacteroidota bacterium]